MPSYTLPYDDVEDLVKVYRGVVPQDIGAPDLDSDEIYALAEMMAIAKNVQDNWTRSAVISYAEGPYLKIRAEERGYIPQDGEDDDTLRQRVQLPPTAVTRQALSDALQALVTATGGGTAYLLELPLQGSYVGQAYVGIGRVSSHVVKLLLGLVPAANDIANGALDILRAKRLAAKSYAVEEY